MRAWVASILALVAAIVVTNPAAAGIDQSYVKPGSINSWGDQLADFVGHKGFSKSYALVVGISQFESYEDLPTSNDPLRMRDYLLQEAGFDQVHVLTDEKATKARIDELMVDVVPSLVDRNDRFLFYWSGHGTQRRIGGHDVGYLPLASSHSDRFSTMVSMDDVRRWDRLLQTEQALFLLDACFSGLAGSAPKGDLRGATIAQLAKPSHHLITAGTGQEQTIAGDRWGGSIFTDAILRAVRGAADARTEYEPDGVVSLSELLDYVRTRVAVEKGEAGWTEAITPQKRDLRTSDGEFFFLTTERKIAKLQNEGADYQGRFEHGMPVVVMGSPTPAPCDRETDRLFWDAIKNETAPAYFEAYLDQVERGGLCGRFAAIARLKMGNALAALPSPIESAPDTEEPPQAEAAVAALPPPTEPEPEPDPAGPDATTNEVALNRAEWMRVQAALTALGFDTRAVDGLPGPRTRSAIIDWQASVGEAPNGYLTAPQHGRLLTEAEPKLAALEAVRPRIEAPSPIEPAVGVFPEAPRPGDVVRDCDQCPEVVVIPEGSFVMGSTQAERIWSLGSEKGVERERVDWERPRHVVEISEPFAMSKYEVTFDEWHACVADGGCNRYVPDDKDWGRGRRPVIDVSWEDAQTYVAWLSEETGHRYRLLTEAEWEYAARAETTTRYSGGDEITPENANYRKSGIRKTTSVGSYPPNPWGLYDLHGNVWEWVEDCLNESYEGAPTDGSAWTSGDCTARMMRGGSWDDEPGVLRLAYRGAYKIDGRRYVTGFRVARTLSNSERFSP